MTVALHPAQRRKIAAQMPEMAAHEVRLRPLGGGDARTVIATSKAQDFVEGLFEDLQAADWRERPASISRSRRAARRSTIPRTCCNRQPKATAWRSVVAR